MKNEYRDDVYMNTGRKRSEFVERCLYCNEIKPYKDFIKPLTGKEKRGGCNSGHNFHYCLECTDKLLDILSKEYLSKKDKKALFHYCNTCDNKIEGLDGLKCKHCMDYDNSRQWANTPMVRNVNFIHLVNLAGKTQRHYNR